MQTSMIRFLFRLIFLPLRFIMWACRWIVGSRMTVVIHVFFIFTVYYILASGDGLFRASFNSTGEEYDLWIFLFFTFCFLHSMGLALLWLRIFRPIPAMLQAMLYLVSTAGVFLWILQFFRPDVSNPYLAMANIVEGAVIFTSLITVFIVYSGKYLLSKKPSALIPSVRDLRVLPHRIHARINSGESIALGLFALIVINTSGLIFIWYRLSRVEEHMGGNRALACSERQTLANTKDAIVRILTASGEGTGMIIRDDGVVLTNAHVVDGEPAPKVILSDYSFKTAGVVMIDKDADVALLKIDGFYTSLALAYPEGLNKLDPLIAVGFPMGTGLKGDATVTRGVYVTTRSTRRSPVSHIHFDGTINAGNSGGPLMTLCGNVVGMVTYGGPGIGLAISSDDLLKRVGFLSEREDPLPVVEVLKLEPENGPLETVTAFYAYIKMRNFEKAYRLLSASRLIGNPLSTWITGYINTLDVTLLKSKLVEKEENTIAVKLTALDLVDQEAEETYFEGTWKVIEENGSWRLGESHIKKLIILNFIGFGNDESNPTGELASNLFFFGNEEWRIHPPGTIGLC